MKYVFLLTALISVITTGMVPVGAMAQENSYDAFDNRYYEVGSHPGFYDPVPAAALEAANLEPAAGTVSEDAGDTSPQDAEDHQAAHDESGADANEKSGTSE